MYSNSSLGSGKHPGGLLSPVTSLFPLIWIQLQGCCYPCAQGRRFLSKVTESCDLDGLLSIVPVSQLEGTDPSEGFFFPPACLPLLLASTGAATAPALQSNLVMQGPKGIPYPAHGTQLRAHQCSGRGGRLYPPIYRALPAAGSVPMGGYSTKPGRAKSI